ncbi:hypothetical protein VP01_781g4 [Puccinia sorghi]|uniref:Uncharacterized protein n=1 Tax=Puccinia sorghi TaxID=27349 RepID=A0A0L6UB63_9BASI|nr:hypothetical protein VP01_781g4 [Puccinia sorghi]
MQMFGWLHNIYSDTPLWTHPCLFLVWIGVHTPFCYTSSLGASTFSHSIFGFKVVSTCIVASGRGVDTNPHQKEPVYSEWCLVDDCIHSSNGLGSRNLWRLTSRSQHKKNIKTKHKSLSMNHIISLILILHNLLEVKYNFKKNWMRKIYKRFLEINTSYNQLQPEFKLTFNVIQTNIPEVTNRLFKKLITPNTSNNQTLILFLLILILKSSILISFYISLSMRDVCLRPLHSFPLVYLLWPLSTNSFLIPEETSLVPLFNIHCIFALSELNEIISFFILSFFIAREELLPGVIKDFNTETCPEKNIFFLFAPGPSLSVNHLGTHELVQKEKLKLNPCLAYAKTELILFSLLVGFKLDSHRQEGYFAESGLSTAGAEPRFSSTSQLAMPEWGAKSSSAVHFGLALGKLAVQLPQVYLPAIPPAVGCSKCYIIFNKKVNLENISYRGKESKLSQTMLKVAYSSIGGAKSASSERLRREGKYFVKKWLTCGLLRKSYFESKIDMFLWPEGNNDFFHWLFRPNIHLTWPNDFLSTPEKKKFSCCLRIFCADSRQKNSYDHMVFGSPSLLSDAAVGIFKLGKKGQRECVSFQKLLVRRKISSRQFFTANNLLGITGERGFGSDVSTLDARKGIPLATSATKIL